MSDTKPPPPAGAHVVGILVVLIGWALIGGAVAIVILMAVHGSINGGGSILAVLVGAIGWVATVIGRSIQHSRAGSPPTNRE